MRKNHRGGGHGRYYGNIYADNVNITNVTNVTSVTQVRSGGGWNREGRKPKGERPPKLARFAGSLGLADADKAFSMDEGEFCCEMGKVLAYNVKGAVNTVEDMGRSVCGLAKCVGRSAGHIFDAVGQLVSAFR